MGVVGPYLSAHCTDRSEMPQGRQPYTIQPSRPAQRDPDVPVQRFWQVAICLAGRGKGK